MSEFFEALRLSWCIVARNWIIFRKNFVANASPTVADPLFALGTLGLGLSPFLGQVDGLNYSQYLAPGIAGTAVLFTGFFECTYGFFFRMSYALLFKAMLATPVGVTEIVMSQYIWVAIRCAAIATGAGLIVDLCGLFPNPWAVLFFPMIAALVSIPCAGIGLLAACYVRNMLQFQAVYSFLIAPIYFLSGMFFPLEKVPIIAGIAQVSPFYHGVKLFQMVAWNRIIGTQVTYHVAVLALFSAILILWSHNRIRAKLLL
jgi:lipooligosaccharide transport system permease protein